MAIARSLIGEPTVVLGDEPMGKVDSETAEMLLGLMRRINRESRPSSSSPTTWTWPRAPTGSSSPTGT